MASDDVEQRLRNCIHNAFVKSVILHGSEKAGLDYMKVHFDVYGPISVRIQERTVDKLEEIIKILKDGMVVKNNAAEKANDDASGNG